MKKQKYFGTKYIIYQMSNMREKAEEVWADFDAIMDIESIADNINIEQKVNCIKRVSASCVHQVVNMLYELRYLTDKELLNDAIEENHEYWSKLHKELLNL